MNKVLDIDHVSFKYDKHNIVLNNVNFSVNSGEFVAIIGPNGSGKSTLLKLILNELHPNQGSITLFGNHLKDADYHDVAYVSQNVGLVYQHVLASVFEVVKAGLIQSRKQAKEKVKEALKLVELENYENELIDQLSGGQQQRVAIAKALITGPKVIILDEPTAGIDKQTSQKLYALLHQLSRKGITILMVTHDLAGCADYIDRTLCVENANICELSKTDVYHELSHKHTHPEVA